MSAGGGGQVLGRAVHYIDLDDTRFQAGMNRAETVARGGFGRINNILRGALAVGIGVSAFNSSIFAIRQSFEFASEGVIIFNARLDQTTAAFEKLLGSRLEAERQFAQLFEFAKRTPFEFDAVLKGATVLQVFGASTNDAENGILGVGKSALLSMENLQLFGDAAASTVDVTGSLSNGFKQSTFWIGRMYQALQNGLPLGRAALSLERLGLLLPEVRKQLELGRDAGASGDELFAIFKTSLERFRGLQRIQQQSFFTQISTVNDNVTRILAKTGRPIFDNIVDFLVRVNEELESDSASKFVDDITAGVARLAVRAKNFLTDPATQQQAREFLHDAVESMKTFVFLAGTLVTVTQPYLKIIQLIVDGVNAITKGFGTNAMTIGTLIALAVRFNRQIRIGADVLSGRSNAFALPRDRAGNVMTAREESVERNRQEAKLRKELAQQEERQRRAAEMVVRTERSIQARRDQIAKNVQSRQDRIDNAAIKAKEDQIRAAERAAAAAVKEDNQRNRIIASVDRERVARLKLGVENNRLAASQAKLTALNAKAAALDLEIADYTRRKADNAADMAKARGGRDPIGRVMSVDQRIQLEQEAQKAIAAQQRAVARARVIAFSPTGTDTDRKRLKAESDELTKLTKNLEHIGKANLAIKQKEIVLTSLLSNAEKERLAIEKQIAAAKLQTAQAAATQQAAEIRSIAAGRTIVQQQTALARLHSATPATPARAGQRILRFTPAAPTRSEVAGLANQSDLLAQRQRRLATETEKTAAKQAELARLTGTTGGAYERFMGVIGRVAQGLFALTLIYEGLNLVSGVLFHDSIPGLISSFRKYGDTLGHARKQAQDFYDTVIDVPKSEEAFRKEIEKTNAEVEEAIKRRDELVARQQREANQPQNAPLLGGTDTGIGIPAGALSAIFGQSGLQREIDEANAKVQELIKLQQKYNEEWFNLNESAKLYRAYLEGNAQLTSDVVRELRELERTDPRFAELMAKIREDMQTSFASLGVDGTVTPAIIARIKRDAEQFRDVGQQSLLAFIEGFTKDQGEVFDAGADLAERIFKAMGRDGAVADIEMGNLQLAIARAVDEMTRLGSVSGITAEEIKRLAGPEGGARILALVDAMGKYEQALKLVERAAERVKEAEDELNRVQAAHARILDEESDKLERLKDDIEKADQARQDEIDTMRERADALRDEADEAARYHKGIIDALNDRRDAIQDEADAVDRAHQERIDAIQEELDALNEAVDEAQQAERDHADAARAAIEGRIDAYRRERGEVDELTEELLARYEAEIGAARRLKDATEQRASSAARDQRRQLLAFDEAIERARQRSDRDEVARLQRERERYQNRSQRQVDLAESRAGVARDDFAEKQAQIEKAAEEQRLRDAEATRNAQERADAKQEELEAAQAQQEADRKLYEERLRSIADEIEAAQDLADKVADDYENRIRQQDKLIKDKEKADREQDARDKVLIANREQHIQNLKDAFEIVQQINQRALDDAKAAQTEAEKFVKDLKDGVTQIDEQNKRWLTQIGLLNEIIAKLQEANQEVGKTPQQNVTPPSPTVGPTPYGPGEAPTQGPQPSSSPRPTPIRNHSGIPGLAPDGYHDEKYGNDWWWVPNGYKYDPAAPGQMSPDSSPQANPSSQPSLPPSNPNPAPPADPTKSPTVGPQALRALDFSRSGLPDTTGAGVPMGAFAGASVADGRTRAEGWEYLPTVNFYGPLMDHVTVRSDEDAKLIGKEIAMRIRESVDQAKRRGRIRQPGG